MCVCVVCIPVPVHAIPAAALLLHEGMLASQPTSFVA